MSQQIDLPAGDPEQHQKDAYRPPCYPVGNLRANDFYLFQNTAQAGFILIELVFQSP